MIEKRPIGAIGSNFIVGGKKVGFPGFKGGAGFGDSYYDEEDDEMDEGVVKFEMFGRKRF